MRSGWPARGVAKLAEPRKHEKYDALIYSCHALAPVRTAVAHPCDETSLTGALDAAQAKPTP
jgi:phosphate acetyltransferase